MEFVMKKKGKKGGSEKSTMQARRYDPDRISNRTTASIMNNQVRSMGAVPPAPPKASAPLNLQGTTTESQQKDDAVKAALDAQQKSITAVVTPPVAAANTDISPIANTTLTTGSGMHGVNHFFSVYTDSDTRIRPLHPAFHPLPSYRLRPELVMSM